MNRPLEVDRRVAEETRGRWGMTLRFRRGDDPRSCVDGISVTPFNTEQPIPTALNGDAADP